MKVIWSNFASNSFFEIYKYYKEFANVKVAQKIKFRIFSATKQLTKHPLSGQIEPNLQKLNEGHRYLIVGNYKIIYKIVKQGVLITDVFDTRQDPTKVFKSTKRPSS